MLLGCSDSRERSSKIELCPTNIDELVSLSAEDLERVDLGRMNLICADAAAGSGQSDVSRLLRKLDNWTEVARAAERKYRPGFNRNPAKYDKAAWVAAQSETSGSAPELKVEAAHLFTHSGPGAIYLRGGSLNARQIQELPKLNWSENGRVVAHGCNSGVWNDEKESVAGSFAKGQGVTAWGQSGFSQFSERPDRRTLFSRVGADSRSVYLWSYGDGVREWTFGEARQANVFDPK